MKVEASSPKSDALADPLRYNFYTDILWSNSDMISFKRPNWGICLGFYLLAECVNHLTKLEKRRVSLSLTLAIIQYDAILGAFLGKTPRVRSTLRGFIGGWLAMVITFGLTNLVDH